MLYYDFTAGNKDYKLRLNIRDVVALEKQIGCNPIMIFGNGDVIPSVTQMASILHQSLQQYHHGISLTDTYNILDEWLADGHTLTDFVPIILEIYKVSGIVANDREGNEKN